MMLMSKNHRITVRKKEKKRLNGKEEKICLKIPSTFSFHTHTYSSCVTFGSLIYRCYHHRLCTGYEDLS